MIWDRKNQTIEIELFLMKASLKIEQFLLSCILMQPQMLSNNSPKHESQVRKLISIRRVPNCMDKLTSTYQLNI